MKSDELYSYLGYAIIAILIFLILKTIMKKNQPEGFMGLFEGTDETAEEEKEETDDPAVKRIEQNVKEIQDATNKTIEQIISEFSKNNKLDIINYNLVVLGS